MKHSSTRELFEYWNTRRGSRSAPERSEIEPGAIRHVLADTFMLTFDPRAGHPFRIAGTRVCAAFGRELKGVMFTEIWARASQNAVRDALTTVATESVGMVAGASGRSCAGAALELEFLVLPLAHRGGAGTRILGALVPTEVPYWLGVETLGHLTLGTTRYLGPQTGPYSLPRTAPAVPPNARVRHGLVIYDGGQA
ncbi:MAG TPA: PAS domain-containing protein [Xanthobacteraceae bacterium]